MTRREFDNVGTFTELIDFCNDEYCDICEDVIGRDEMDEILREYVDHGYWNTWSELGEELSNIPDSSETGFYAGNGEVDFEELTIDDFDRYWTDVRDWMDYNDRWDEDEEDEEEYEEEVAAEPADEPIDEEDISIYDLISVCHDQMTQNKQAIA